MSDFSMSVDLSELRSAFDAVLTHLESTRGTVVQLPVDYFWSVVGDAKYDVQVDPPLAIGQVTESWDNLKRERVGDSDGTIGYAAVWLGEVLVAIGDTTVS